MCFSTTAAASRDLETQIHICAERRRQKKKRRESFKGRIATDSRQESKGRPGVAELLTKTEHFASQTSDITKASDARLKPHNCLGFLYYSLFYC